MCPTDMPATKPQKRVREKKAVPMPEQPPLERVHNFNEVPLGYSPNMAIDEALRCFQCKGDKASCIPNCPVGIDIPKFIALIAEGKFKEAYDTVAKDNMLPSICGRVCPQETQCQLKCIANIKGESISVGRLERFLGDWYSQQGNGAVLELIPEDAPKVAVIGSGPAGLTCAADLARLKYNVTVFEALHAPGGVLTYGIPEFRLPKAIIKREASNISRMGVKFYYNAIVGRLFTIKDLFENQGYQAVFIGSGAGLPMMMDIPGQNLKGVYSANEFLTRINLMRSYQFPNSPTPLLPAKKVVVTGGGNVAMDCARTALRMGASEVTIVYRRSRQEMPARHEEIEHAEQEGIRFLFLATPIRLLGDPENNLRRVECQEMELGTPDSSGRPRPVPKKGSEFQLEAEIFVIAIGQGPNPILAQTTPGLEVDKWGRILVDPVTRQSSLQGVFAGGDIIGGATVISAMGDGRAAARAIHGYICNKTAATVN
jgi:glutamate synthase (NADPH/NADH) small chain